jgi:MYXO-CTERM domain-containing protein
VYSLAALAFLASVATACAPEGEPARPQEQVGQVIQPIIGGTASGTEQDFVIVLTTFQNGVRTSLCSASLVAPNLVLTARHCVSDADSSSACAADGTAISGAAVKDDRSASDLVVFSGPGGVVPDTTVAKNGSALGAKLIVEPETTLCNHDIAFVVLDRALTGPVASIRLGAPALDETVSAIGWGVDATGKLAPTRQIRAGIPLIGLGPAQYPNDNSYGYGSSEFMIGESACAGDSGSPAIATTGALVGVAARAGNGLAHDPNNYAATCVGATAHAVYTHLGEHKDLVTAAFAAAGAQPKLEALPQTIAASGGAAGGGADGPGASAPKPDPAPAASAAAPPASAADGSPKAGGCSMSSEPETGQVEYAAGVAALLALIFGLRRRLRQQHSYEEEHEPHRERLPSMP